MLSRLMLLWMCVVLQSCPPISNIEKLQQFTQKFCAYQIRGYQMSL